jgi:hypothetical protein
MLTEALTVASSACGSAMSFSASAVSSQTESMAMAMANEYLPSLASSGPSASRRRQSPGCILRSHQRP